MQHQREIDRYPVIQNLAIPDEPEIHIRDGHSITCCSDVHERTGVGRFDVPEAGCPFTIGNESPGFIGTFCEGRAKWQLPAVGENGELEHAAAILHPRMGKPLRAAVEKGASLVPSTKKRGGMGQDLDVPLGHKDAAYVRSHFDGVEIRIHDAPRANEILVAIAVTDSGRPLPRVGGLEAQDAKGEDGLR